METPPRWRPPAVKAGPGTQCLCGGRGPNTPLPQENTLSSAASWTCPEGQLLQHIPAAYLQSPPALLPRG